MPTSFMHRAAGPDATLAFQSIKATYGMRQFMRIPVPPSAGPATGPSGFAWDILSWECHLDPNDKRHKSSHIYYEKVNVWWNAEYRDYIRRAFERLYHSEGVCGCIQVFDLDTHAVEDTWLFFGWYDEAAMSNEQRRAA